MNRFLVRTFFRLTQGIVFAILLGLLTTDRVAMAAPPAPDPNPTFTVSSFVAGKPMHLVAYGDMRFTDPSVTSGTNPRVRRWLADQIAREKPQVVLLTGDMPYTGAKDADWQEFQTETAGWRAGHILELPTIGNHELNGGSRGMTNYMSNFPQLGGHRYYSALLGSVEVISLDMTSPTGASADQSRWFQAQLSHLRRQVQFLFILYHIPWMADEQSKVFARLPSKEAISLRNILEANLPRLHARVVVLNGHIHNYERFERNGVEYVITGGGGAEPYPLLFRGSDDLYRDSGFPVYHYLTIQISNGEMHVVMWKVKDPDAGTLSVEAKDQFTLYAPPSPARSSPVYKPKANPAPKR